MSDTASVILVVGVVALVLIFVMGPRLGIFKFKLPGASVEAEGAKGGRGASVKRAKARLDVEAIDHSGQGAGVEDAEAGGSVRAVSGTPPKE